MTSIEIARKAEDILSETHYLRKIATEYPWLAGVGVYDGLQEKVYSAVPVVGRIHADGTAVGSADFLKKMIGYDCDSVKRHPERAYYHPEEHDLLISDCQYSGYFSGKIHLLRRDALILIMDVTARKKGGSIIAALKPKMICSAYLVNCASSRLEALAMARI